MTDDIVARLRKQVAYASATDRKYERPMNWDEADALLSEIERLRALAREYFSLAMHVGGCGDGNCVVLRPRGMRTNGGCRCTSKMDQGRQRQVTRLLMKAQELASAALKGNTDA